MTSRMSLAVRVLPCVFQASGLGSASLSWVLWATIWRGQGPLRDPVNPIHRLAHRIEAKDGESGAKINRVQHKPGSGRFVPGISTPHGSSWNISDEGGNNGWLVRISAVAW